VKGGLPMTEGLKMLDDPNVFCAVASRRL